MKTLLTAPDIEYLRGQQMKLDGDIIKKNGITHDEWMEDLHTNHIIALRVEVAEFVNATYDSWKYWKKKPVDRERIIDEAVDVIHFLMLLLNKYPKAMKGGDFAEVIRMALPKSGTSVKEALNIMLTTYMLDEVLAYLLYVLDHYNFTTQDILDAYNRKNKVNFERLESGY